VQGADQHLTYRALFEAVEVRAAWLGSQPQGAFALALDNGPQLLLWDLAALFAERPCVVIPPFFTRAQMSHCLRQSGVTLVLSESGWDSRLVELGYAPHARPGFWLCKSYAAAAIAPETAKITYTSGSTGSPKGVCLSAEALLGVAHELEAASRASAPMHHLAVLPLGVLLENLGVYAALIAGACVHLLSQQHLGISGATQVDFKRLVGVIVQR
ncbi:MAG TPA: long-chain acyl-CoA synthetase, partial [Pseudomonas sp.]|nr:long-chain acyl-CoA synthetase [Pseudomonas sp.]